MNDNIRVGRVAGFPVSLNWSVLIIAWLLTWSLATTTFAHHASGSARITLWLAGLGTAVIFFASLLVHEVAHAVVARRHGVEVTGLTLWLFGGVASLGSEPSTPRADFRIALAGPAASLLLGAGFGLTGLGLRTLDIGGLPSVAAAWLAVINLLLGVTNLLPGAPLDGGRVLRAFLWHRHGDQLRATVSAARAGSAIAFVLIGLGLVEVLDGARMSGLWLALIGWFVLAAAREQQHEATVRIDLAGLRVADVMHGDLMVVPGSMTVNEFVAGFAHLGNDGAYPVSDVDGRIIGVADLPQLRRLSPERAMAPLSDVALDLAGVPVAAPEDHVTLFIDRLSEGPGDRVLVLAEGTPIGFFTLADAERAADDVRRSTAVAPHERSVVHSDARTNNLGNAERDNED